MRSEGGRFPIVSYITSRVVSSLTVKGYQNPARSDQRTPRGTIPKDFIMMDETPRFEGVSRRKLLQASAVGIGAVGLAGCTAADASQATPTPELDLETLEADTAFGTLQAERAEHSYVGPIDEGQAVGIAFVDDVGAGENHELDDGIVVHLYDREDHALMLGELDAAGAATLESEERSAFEATIDLVMADDVVTGAVTVVGENPTEFTADAATDIAGVYWAHGTDEEPAVSGDWVVLSDGRQWGCVCLPPRQDNPCCLLRQ